VSLKTVSLKTVSLKTGFELSRACRSFLYASFPCEFGAATEQTSRLAAVFPIFGRGAGSQETQKNLHASVKRKYCAGLENFPLENTVLVLKIFP
jgi:hypothetical protein